MNEANNVLTIKTVQIQPIRNTITAIKDILTDATITFTPDCMKIINFDKTHTILVNVILHARKFEKFTCTPDKIIVCANTIHLFRVISTMSNDDTLSMYIEKNDYNDGIVSHLGLQYDNGKIEQCTNYKLRLFEPDEDELEVPEVNYSAIIIMPSAGFQKIIRDFTGLTDRIKIESVGDDLIFSGVGPFCTSRVFRREQYVEKPAFNDKNVETIKFKKKPDPTVVMQGEFPLKCLNNIIKCSPLSPHLELYLENDLPLIVKYEIGADMGHIKLCLSPLPPLNYS
jgi:proliferating cell nuclear antigen